MVPEKIKFKILPQLHWRTRYIGLEIQSQILLGIPKSGLTFHHIISCSITNLARNKTENLLEYESVGFKEDFKSYEILDFGVGKPRNANLFFLRIVFRHLCKNKLLKLSDLWTPFKYFTSIGSSPS